MRISTRKLPIEPLKLKTGLKWNWRDSTGQMNRTTFFSEFRVIGRNEWGDDEYAGVLNFETFEEALKEFRDQQRMIDAKEVSTLVSTEIETVLGWESPEDGIVDCEEIEIYHYGLSEYREE